MPARAIVCSEDKGVPIVSIDDESQVSSEDTTYVRFRTLEVIRTFFGMTDYRIRRPARLRRFREHDDKREDRRESDTSDSSLLQLRRAAPACILDIV